MCHVGGQQALVPLQAAYLRATCCLVVAATSAGLLPKSELELHKESYMRPNNGRFLLVSIVHG